MKRVILVADLDSFFASVEEKHDPSIVGKPVAVGGGAKDGKGVIVTANYLAKSKGIYVGMPYFKANRLMPELIIKEANHELYLAESESVFQIVKGYTDSIELGSIDEAYMDVTEKLRKSGLTAVEYARQIQLHVLRETGLGISIGISSNRIMAKMASGMDKPKGVTTLWENELNLKLWPLPVRELFYVGAKTAEKLNELGYNTIGEMAAVKYNTEAFQELENILGKQWTVLWGFANGYSSDRVDEVGAYTAKSIGKAETFGKYLDTYNSQKEAIFKLTKIVVERMQYRNVIASTVGIGIKSAVTGLGPKVMPKMWREKLDFATNDLEKIYVNIMRLYDKHWDTDEPIKYIGVTVTDLQDAYYKVEQLDVFNYGEVDASEYTATKGLIKDLNAMIGYEALTDGEAISSYKKWVDKSLTNDDRMKFKQWS